MVTSKSESGLNILAILNNQLRVHWGQRITLLLPQNVLQFFGPKMEEQNSPGIFCEWLKRRRKALDLTQVELAERVGCSVGALRKIESGERRPSKQLAGLLAKALEISNEYQQTFIRVARGELDLERLREPAPEPRAPFPDFSSLRQTRHS
jgi:transcriptional regulator with XRE-family HTH domain